MKVVLLFLVFCASDILYLFGGKDVTYSEHINFIVSLQDDTDHFCNGALVSLKFILTAASCVDDKQPQDIKVKGLILTHSSPGIPMVVEEIIYKNASAQNNVRNNIALLRIAEITAEDSDQLKPFGLKRLDNNNGAIENEGATMYGWGKMSVSTLIKSN